MNAYSRARLGLVPRRRAIARPSCAFSTAPEQNLDLPLLGRVPLLGDWASLLHGLARLGPLITMTSHPAASLAVMGSYPDLDVSDGGLWAANDQRRLSLDFSSWDEVHCIERFDVGGICRGLEVFDRDQVRTHVATLLSDHRAGQFHELLAEHRETATITPWRTQAVRASAPWQPKLHYRIPVLSLSSGVTCTRLELRALPEIFCSLQAMSVGVLAGVYTEAVIQRHAWLIADTAEASGWLYARGPQSALHLALGDLLEAWCVNGRCGCCGEDRMTVEIYDRHQKLACTLQAAENSEEMVWREICGV